MLGANLDILDYVAYTDAIVAEDAEEHEFYEELYEQKFDEELEEEEASSNLVADDTEETGDWGGGSALLNILSGELRTQPASQMFARSLF